MIIGDFDDRMTQASESDKVGVQHDIQQHQSWLELPFGKLKIYDKKSRMPVVNMLKPRAFQFQNIKQEATEEQPKELTAINQATTNTKHLVT